VGLHDCGWGMRRIESRAGVPAGGTEGGWVGDVDGEGVHAEIVLYLLGIVKGKVLVQTGDMGGTMAGVDC